MAHLPSPLSKSIVLLFLLLLFFDHFGQNPFYVNSAPLAHHSSSSPSNAEIFETEDEFIEMGAKESIADFSSRPAEASTLSELLKQERDVEERRAVERAIDEISTKREYRMTEERRKKTEKQFISSEQKRKELREPFDLDKFRADVLEGKRCDEEPLKVAKYDLIEHSSAVGVNHAALLVCGIEIHFHHPGVQFWRPMEYATKSGVFLDYHVISYNGKELKTQKSFREVVSVVEQLKKEFNSSTYNMMTHNCLLFLRTLARQLTGLTNKEEIDWPLPAIHPGKKLAHLVKKGIKSGQPKNVVQSKGGKGTSTE